VLCVRAGTSLAFASSVSGEANRFRKRRLVDLKSIELGPEIEQQLRIEAGADFAGEDKVVIFVYPTSRAPRPARLPCGSVKPPTTNSWASSHFIFSQFGERRCS